MSLTKVVSYDAWKSKASDCKKSPSVSWIRGAPIKRACAPNWKYTVQWSIRKTRSGGQIWNFEKKSIVMYIVASIKQVIQIAIVIFIDISRWTVVGRVLLRSVADPRGRTRRAPRGPKPHRELATPLQRWRPPPKRKSWIHHWFGLIWNILTWIHNSPV